MDNVTPQPFPTPPPAPTAGAGKDSFIQKTAVIVLALLCCWPVGLVFTWLHPRWSMMTKGIITAIIAAIVGLGMVMVVALGALVDEVADEMDQGGSERSSEPTPPTAVDIEDDDDVDAEPVAGDESEPEPEPEPEPQPDETVAQQNAVRAAKNYLDFSAFSRSGLIEQLEFEGYESADAEYAVDAIGADWMEQAAKKAEAYMEYSAFSRSGLIEQLEFEGFTRKQAEYGADAVGL